MLILAWLISFPYFVYTSCTEIYSTTLIQFCSIQTNSSVKRDLEDKCLYIIFHSKLYFEFQELSFFKVKSSSYWCHEHNGRRRHLIVSEIGTLLPVTEFSPTEPLKIKEAAKKARRFKLFITICCMQ